MKKWLLIVLGLIAVGAAVFCLAMKNTFDPYEPRGSADDPD